MADQILSLKNTNEFFRFNPRWLRLTLVTFIIVWAMFLRIEWRAKKVWSTDETIQIRLMAGPVKDMIQNQLAIVQYPGDYLLMWPFYQVFGKSKRLLPIPHLVLTGVGFILLYMMCRQYFQTLWGYLIAFLVAAKNSNLINYAGEVRPYTVLATLGIAGFLMTKLLVKNQNPSGQQRFWVSLFVFFTLTFHFYGAFILFFNYLFHLICSRNNESWWRVILRNLKAYWPALLITFPFWAYFTFVSDKSYMNWNPYEYIPRGIIPWLKGVFGNLIGYRPFYFLLAGLILALSVPHKMRWQQIVFFTVVILAPIGFIFWSCVQYQYWFIQRLFIWAMPLFAFLLGWQWDALFVYFSGKLEKT